MATADQFREAKKIPFSPFLFKLADGTIFAVKHPDWLAIPPSDFPREVVYFAPRNALQYDTHRIDLAMVIDVILPPADEMPETTDGNGSVPERG